MCASKIEPELIYDDIRLYIFFAARYHRQIFKYSDAMVYMRDAINQVNERFGINLFECEFSGCHVYLCVRIPSSMSAAEVISQYKRASMNIFRDNIFELKDVRQIWTRKYFVSTHKPHQATLDAFLTAQPNRPLPRSHKSESGKDFD